MSRGSARICAVVFTSQKPYAAPLQLSARAFSEEQALEIGKLNKDERKMILCLADVEPKVEVDGDVDMSSTVDGDALGSRASESVASESGAPEEGPSSENEKPSENGKDDRRTAPKGRAMISAMIHFGEPTKRVPLGDATGNANESSATASGADAADLTAAQRAAMLKAEYEKAAKEAKEQAAAEKRAQAELAEAKRKEQDEAAASSLKEVLKQRADELFKQRHVSSRHARCSHTCLSFECNRVNQHACHVMRACMPLTTGLQG